MDELIVSVGFICGVLYYYFGDKKGLLVVVVQQIDDEMNFCFGVILVVGEDFWSGFCVYNWVYLEMVLEVEIQCIVLCDVLVIFGSFSSEVS